MKTVSDDIWFGEVSDTGVAAGEAGQAGHTIPRQAAQTKESLAKYPSIVPGSLLLRRHNKPLLSINMRPGPPSTLGHHRARHLA